jgi:hypothetical protein
LAFTPTVCDWAEAAAVVAVVKAEGPNIIIVNPTADAVADAPSSHRFRIMTLLSVTPMDAT